MILSNFTDTKTTLRTYFLPYLVSHFIIFIEIMEKLTVGCFINKMPLPDKKTLALTRNMETFTKKIR